MIVQITVKADAPDGIEAYLSKSFAAKLSAENAARQAVL